MTKSMALREYLPAFEREDDAFLSYWSINPDKTVARSDFTRGEFWALGAAAAGALEEAGLGPGDAAVHYFTDNAHEDLAFRLGATMLGTVPVTVNWQADTPERVAYKLSITEARALVVDAGVAAAAIDSLRAEFPKLAVIRACELGARAARPDGGALSAFAPSLGPEDTRIIIFTSGTTGQPKGVRLSYAAYHTNRATFEDFLRVPSGCEFVPFVCNPMARVNVKCI